MERLRKRDEKFYPWGDWAMPEIQAEDQRRAESKEAQRQKRHPEPTFKTKPRWGNVETNEWGPREREVNERWGKDNYTNWNYQTEEWEETETERSDRRSRNSKEHLIEAWEIRVEGIKKNEERERRKRENVEKNKYMRRPEQTTGTETRRSRRRTKGKENTQKETPLRTNPIMRAK